MLHNGNYQGDDCHDQQAERKQIIYRYVIHRQHLPSAPSWRLRRKRKVLLPFGLACPLGANRLHRFCVAPCLYYTKSAKICQFMRLLSAGALFFSLCPVPAVLQRLSTATKSPASSAAEPTITQLTSPITAAVPIVAEQSQQPFLLRELLLLSASFSSLLSSDNLPLYFLSFQVFYPMVDDLDLFL